MKMGRELVKRAWRLGINFSEFSQRKLKREAGEDEGVIDRSGSASVATARISIRWA
jgi:hypothetical protein